ncbi:MAG: hypothetical protein A3F68_09240 [Acidobacteria bacterium RIFCSPLOWO2_12_FULL_54_10]|nr:MAG: hypothetical protein A3F68_09240 [Acidobacteria bacterium RIFCSPLOWO2_12_FULL_54_10]
MMKSNRRKYQSLILAALFFGLLSTGASVSSVRWLADVKHLSSEEFKGRGNGMPELDKAADFIAAEFRKAGLEVLNNTAFQPFEAVVGADLGTKNSLALSGSPDRSYRVTKDFTPLSFSASGSKTAPLAFAGYGITAPEYQYDDYAGIDVKGKAVIVLRHEPQEEDANSVFRGKETTRHAALVNKAVNARNHGAAAMILVNDPLNHSGDALVSFADVQGPSDIGIPILHVKRDIVEEWLKPTGKSLRDLQKLIDADLSKHSFVLAGDPAIKLEADIRHRKAALKNVIGYLPGSDPALRNEVIVIGAHYDHLGLGEQDSMSPSEKGKIHYGADDNASGTAGIIELARLFNSERHNLRRSILFMAFAGEELGLLGSAHYVETPLIPLSRTIAMLNLDMIGRTNKNKLYIGGVGTSPVFRSMLTAGNEEFKFNLDFSDSGYGGSDHMSFNRKQVPVLFFFSGLHKDYHRPSDTWEKQEPEETAKVLELVASVARSLDDADERPLWTPVQDPRRGRRAESDSQPAQDSESGYGPYFGAVPDFGEIPDGVKMADIREGSPAANAGLRADDILIQFDGQEVKTLYDFTYLLRSKQPGDEVPVIVLRDGMKIETRVKLARRE